MKLWENSTRSAIYCYGTLVWRIVAGLSFCQQTAHLNTTEVTSKIHTLLHSEFSHVSRKFPLTFHLFALWISKLVSFFFLFVIHFLTFFYFLYFIFIFSINFHVFLFRSIWYTSVCDIIRDEKYFYQRKINVFL